MLLIVLFYHKLINYLPFDTIIIQDLAFLGKKSLKLNDITMDEETRLKILSEFKRIPDKTNRDIVNAVKKFSVTKNRKVTGKILYLSSGGDLYKEPKSKYCYPMINGSDRYKILRYLATHKGYQLTSDISKFLEGKPEQSIRTEVPKIRLNIKKFLKIDGLKVIDPGEKGRGYRINPECKIILKDK